MTRIAWMIERRIRGGEWEPYGVWGWVSVPDATGMGGFLVPPEFAADLRQMMEERAELAAHGFAGMFCQVCRCRFLALGSVRDRSLLCPLCHAREVTWDGVRLPPWSTQEDEKSRRPARMFDAIFPDTDGR